MSAGRNNVTIIPATISQFTAMPINSKAKRKVAAYARVSTELEEQQSSYEAQVSYYTEYIKSRADWEFVDIYADEGISGCNTVKRDGFRKMVEDALAGKIGLIITKSISRFARNTVDSLSTIRKLKDNGTEVYFEKENIWTFDSKGEFLISLLSSMAQEESRSISENVLWGVRKKMADGKFSLAYSSFLGYDKGDDGNRVINEEQAKIVRKIYDLFLKGLSPRMIAIRLTDDGIKTPMGKDKWNPRTVKNILENEKYKGDALLQKNYTVSFLTKEKRKNTGEVQQFYVSGCHEAIISPDTFELVQAEIARRKNEKNRYSGVSIFSSKIKCGECGNWYGAKTWHSTDKYRRTIYRCNHKYGGKKCQTPHLTEDEIKLTFVNAFNRLFSEREELIANIEEAVNKISNTVDLETKRDDLAEHMRVLVDMTQNCINENARIAQDQTEYQKRYNDLVSKYESCKEKYEATVAKIDNRHAKGKILKNFLMAFRSQEEILMEFDESLWSAMVDFMTVYGKGDIGVTFKDGMEIR